MKNIKRIILLLSLAIVILSCGNNTNKNKSAKETDEKDKNTEVREIVFDTYCNGRFGFCIEYPIGILIPQGESANGDGQVFTSENEQISLWVYRDYRDNVDPSKPFDIKIAYNEDLDDKSKKITYKYLGEKYYVISGYNDGKIFYQKTIITKDGLATALIEYPESEKDFYDGIDEVIFNTFKWHEHGWIEA